MSDFRISPGVFRGRRKPFQRPVLIRAMYKSSLEDTVAKYLEDHGHSFEYETQKIKYVVPEREATYTPDFHLKNGIIIEAKGWLTTEDRQKLLLVKKSHPDKDIRLFFHKNPDKQKIYKGSKTTYAMWCEANGFPYAWKVIPEDWLKEP